MKKTLQNIGIGLVALFSSASLSAQCPTITCPGDITVSNDAGDCGAVVNYTTPVGTDPCASSNTGDILVVSDVAGATEIEPALTAEGHNVTVVNNDYNGGDNTVLQGGGLSAYDVIYWHAVGTGSGGTHNAATFTNLNAYVNAGGAIFVHGYDVIASPTDTELITFLGGSSSADVPGNGGLGTIAGPANSLTDGVTNIVGLTLNNGGDHDALVNLQAGTVGVAPNNSGWDWTLKTLGSGEIAWVSTGQSTGAFAQWSTAGSGYAEALLNFAHNNICSPGDVLFVCDGDNTTASEIPAELNAAGYTVTTVYNDYSAGDNATLQGSIAAYDAIFWHASGASGYGEAHNAATFTNLTTYVNNGGAIFITGYDVIASPTDQELINFMGGTSSTDGGSQGTETLVGSNSLTTGVTNIVGLTLAASGDHDGLNNLQAGTVGVATNGSSHGWSIRTLGAGEVAWVSTANSLGQPWSQWNTPGSGYNEALLNFAYNHANCGSAGGVGNPTTTMIAGLADGSVFPVGTTTVTYEVVDGNGNNPQTCSFDVTVTDDELPVADVATLADTSGACDITPIAPTATDNCGGTITGTPDVTFPVTAQGTTTVTWTYDDGNGNLATQTQDVIITGVETGVTQNGSTLTADAVGTTYQWLDCNDNYAVITGETNASFTPTATVGDYAVEVNDNGCVDTSACFLVDYTGLSDLDMLGLSVYPNPNTGNFFVESSNGLLNSIIITDNEGRKVNEISTINQLKTSINMIGVSPGIYFVEMTGEFGKATKRIVVQ